MSNAVVSLIQSHRSIRRYTEQPVAEEILQEIYKSAQWAPTSHNVQAYSIIVVKNSETKKKLAACCGQPFIGTSPVFMVFCADFYRLKQTCDMYQSNFVLDGVEGIVVGAVDTALAAENAFITAKSFGLGGVMIGGIRDNAWDVAKLLKLPKYTIPIAGMCLGYPAEEPWQKPRLPQRIVVHEESYQTERVPAGLQEYEIISADYYTRRSNGRQTEGWTKQMADYLSRTRRPDLKKFIESQGMDLN